VFDQLYATKRDAFEAGKSTGRARAAAAVMLKAMELRANGEFTGATFTADESGAWANELERIARQILDEK
jgi:hypothetical protein